MTRRYPLSCACCGEDGRFIGQLGAWLWWRCPSCLQEWATNADDTDEVTS